MITVIRALFGLGPVVYVCCPSGFRSAFFNRSRPFYLLFGTTVHEPQSDSPPVWQRVSRLIKAQLPAHILHFLPLR